MNKFIINRKRST